MVNNYESLFSLCYNLIRTTVQTDGFTRETLLAQKYIVYRILKVQRYFTSLEKRKEKLNLRKLNDSTWNLMH